MTGHMCLTDTDRRIENLIYYVSTRDIRVGGKESPQTISCFLFQQFHIVSALILVDYTNQINWNGLSNQQCESSREKICAMHLRSCSILVENLGKWFTIGFNGILNFDVVTWVEKAGELRNTDSSGHSLSCFLQEFYNKSCSHYTMLRNIWNYGFAQFSE